MINIAEIDTLNNYCITLLSLTKRMERDTFMKEAYNLSENILKSIRKLVIASAFYNKKIICVSGIQGAGKTTLMKNFYGLDDGYLNISLGRGERIPVFITEKEIKEPYACARRMEKDENGKYGLREIKLSPKEFVKASKGNDSDIMCLELFVPNKHTYYDGVSFMLLPGFEEKNDYWNNLIEFSVHSSDAAVFVFGETSFANASNEKYLELVEKKFGNNLIYVITGADKSSDGNKEVKENCMDCLKIPERESDRVVCVGDFSDQEKNKAWINNFKNSLEKYAFKDTQHLQKNNSYIYDEMEKIRDSFDEILEIIDRNSSEEIKSYHDVAILKAFDNAIKKRREIIEKRLRAELNKGKGESIKNLEELFSTRPKVKQIKRLFFGSSVKEQYIQTREMIEKSLRGPQGIFIPQKCIGLALQNSLKDLTTSQCTRSIKKLVDIKKIDEKKLMDVNGEKTKALINDVQCLLSEEYSAQSNLLIQTNNVKKLVDAVAEMATYYMGCNLCFQLEEATGNKYYIPTEVEVEQKDFNEEAKASQRFSMGMAGVLGIDVLEDGSFNMISKLAACFELPVPVTAAIAVGIITAGGILSIINDLNRMQRSDLESAKRIVGEVYDNFRDKLLEWYESSMDNIRDRIEDNLTELGGDGRKIVDEYNAKIVLNKAVDYLEEMLKEYREEKYGLRSTLY